MRTVLLAATALSFVPMMANAQAPAAPAAPAVAPAAPAVAPAAPVAPVSAPAVEAPKEEATKVGGQIRVSMLLSDSKDGKAVQHYGLGLERARLMFSKTKGKVEGVVHLRFEGNQNGKDNEGDVAATTANGVFENVNRAYINFMDLAPGLNVQIGKKPVVFGDDADYGLAAIDAWDKYGKFNDAGYGLGLFADYAIPQKMGKVSIALVNGNGKTNAENNTQKGFVSNVVVNPIEGVAVNVGYAVNTPKSAKDAKKKLANASDTYLVAGASTTLVPSAMLGLDYYMRTAKFDSKLVNVSGSGLAAKATYKYEDLKLIAVYNRLTKNLEEKVEKGYFDGDLDTATKTPAASTAVLAAEYGLGAAFVGLQYKSYMNDAKVATDKDGKADSKNYGDVKLYTQMTF